MGRIVLQGLSKFQLPPSATPFMVSLSNHCRIEEASFDRLRMKRRRRTVLLRKGPGSSSAAHIGIGAGESWLLVSSLPIAMIHAKATNSPVILQNKSVMPQEFGCWMERTGAMKIQAHPGQWAGPKHSPCPNRKSRNRVVVFVIPFSVRSECGPWTPAFAGVTKVALEYVRPRSKGNDICALARSLAE